MRVRVKASLRPGKPSIEGVTPRSDYPLRGAPFLVSVAVHGMIAAALMTVDFPASKRPVYDEFIKPKNHQLLYFDIRPKVPHVNPVKRVGNTPNPRGVELSKLAIIAASKKPKSEQVFISAPAPKVDIRQDVPAPLLVTRLDTIIPTPAAPAKVIPKKFIPPPPSKTEPKLPMQTPVVEAPAPPQYSAAPSPLMTQITMPTLTTPAHVAPPAPTAHTGNANADVAIASLHPSENPDTAVPNGDRPGRFSKAPTQGPAASGDANATASLTVPDLTIRPPKAGTPSAAAPPHPRNSVRRTAPRRSDVHFVGPVETVQPHDSAHRGRAFSGAQRVYHRDSDGANGDLQRRLDHVVCRSRLETRRHAGGSRSGPIPET